MYVPPRAARERRRGNMVAELLPRLDPTRREDRLITEMIENALKLLRENDFAAVCSELDGLPDVDPWVADETELLAAARRCFAIPRQRLYQSLFPGR